MCGGDDWRTTEDGDNLALARREHGRWSGWRESRHGERVRRLSRRPQQGRRAAPTPFRDRDRAPIAIPMDGLDELLGLPSIPNGLPHRPDRAAKRGITDELVGPDLGTQLVFGYDTITMF